MLIEETYVEVQNKGLDHEIHYQLGSSGLFKPYTDDIKQLFCRLQREYGRCTSKVYLDALDGTIKAIGWIFEKRRKYDDCEQYYTQETWIILHDEQPEVKTINHYHFLS